jgi:fructokinase
VTSTSTFHAGIDAGGTTFKCGIYDAKGDVIAKQRVKLSHPTDTADKCLHFFTQAMTDIGAELSDLASFGIASFGPLDLDPNSPHYGSILNTPKSNWSHINLRRIFAEKLGLSVAIDTDVNGALLAEMMEGAARGLSCGVYTTIGTGIGAAIVINGNFVARPSHPEFGHIPIMRHSLDDYAGACPFHKDCLEGLASATAMRNRFGDTQQLAEDHWGWEMEAFYLAQACVTQFLTLRPQRIILGGGLMLAPFLIDKIREAFKAQLASYIPLTDQNIRELITLPQLGDDAGLRGAVLLGIEAIR